MNYARDGYAIVPLSGADEVEAMRAAVSAHIDRMARALLKPYAETAPEAPFDERLERGSGRRFGAGRIAARLLATASVALVATALAPALGRADAVWIGTMSGPTGRKTRAERRTPKLGLGGANRN